MSNNSFHMSVDRSSSHHCANQLFFFSMKKKYFTFIVFYSVSLRNHDPRQHPTIFFDWFLFNRCLNENRSGGGGSLSFFVSRGWITWFVQGHAQGWRQQATNDLTTEATNEFSLCLNQIIKINSSCNKKTTGNFKLYFLKILKIMISNPINKRKISSFILFSLCFFYIFFRISVMQIYASRILHQIFVILHASARIGTCRVYIFSRLKMYLQRLVEFVWL